MSEMKILPVNEGLVTFDIRWKTTTAGPSPDNNQRVELFLLGCKKAQQGNPCKGCFNSVTWDISKAEFSRDPIEIADFIAKNAPNKYITIGGGEPTDQIEHLVPLTKRLKEHGFHIMMYTWRDLEKSKDCDFQYVDINNSEEYVGRLDLAIKDLLENIDVVIDGEFKQEEKMYKEDCSDGMFGSIGSGNQRIWDIRNNIKYPMKDLDGIKLDSNNNLIYIKREV